MTWAVKNKASAEGFIAVFGGKKGELIKWFKFHGYDPKLIQSRQDFYNWYFIIPRTIGLELTNTDKDYNVFKSMTA